MEDAQIIDLFLARSETAISQTAIRYGRYLKTIARNILPSEEDAEEVLNEVAKQMAELLKEVNKEKNSFKDLGITYEEKAFYDILKYCCPLKLRTSRTLTCIRIQASKNKNLG